MEKVGYFTHPGGKLREFGAKSLTDAELLSIIIGTGTNENSATTIAEEIMKKYKTFLGMAGKSFDEFLEIKGMGEVKVHRLAATLEIARRILLEVE